MMAHTDTNDNSERTAEMSNLFQWAWLAALLIIAAALRIHNTDSFSYNADEAMHIHMAEGSSISQVWQFSQYEAHPPLGNLLRHYWMEISSEVWFVRSQSMLFGLALILLYYRIGLLIAGRPAAIVCATLVAFSHGAIIQSYVVRNYIAFLFFLSLGFYAYLHWRNNRRPAMLLAYMACGWLAVLTHFSGIFCILCIGVFETIHLYRQKAPVRCHLQWALANLSILLVAVAIYHAWQPILVPLKSYFVGFLEPLPQMVKNTLVYPYSTGDYMFPSHLFTSLLLPAMAAYALLPRLILRKGTSVRPLIALAALALLVGMALYFTQIYPPLGTRRNFWIFPLLVPVAGAVLGDALEHICIRLLPTMTALRLPVIALIALIAGLASYDAADRFHDGSEYAMPRKQSDTLGRYLETLGPKDLIITEKDDGIMLTNLYRVMGTDAFTGAHMSALAAYGNTHILFNPYYPRNYSRNVLLATLEEAQTGHMFDEVQRLVFLRMAWSRSPLNDLMTCDTLTKQLVGFPPFEPNHPMDSDYIYTRSAALMIVPKERFLSEVMAQDGKARTCLDGKHDMVPGFMPPHY